MKPISSLKTEKQTRQNKVLIDMQRNSVAVTQWEGTTRVSTSIFEASDASIAWEDSAELTQWLGEIFRLNNLSGSDVYVSLPRHSVCIHLLTLPKLTDKALMDVIPIQLEPIYGTTFSTISHDIVRLGDLSSARDMVMVATAPKKLVNRIKQLCDSNRMLIRRLSCIDFIASEIGSARTDLSSSTVHPILIAQSNRLQLALTFNNQVIQSQAISIDSGLPVPNTVRGRMRLLEAALPEAIQSLEKAKGTLLIDSEVDEKAYFSLATELGFLVERVDLKAAYALVDRSTSLHRIDFVNRWKPHSKKISAKVIAMCTAALMLIGGFVVNKQMIHAKELEGELKELETRLSSIEADLEARLPYGEKWELLQSWKASQISWGRELVEIAEQSDRSKNAYLHRVQFESNDADLPAVIRFDGRARSVTDAIAWNHFDDKVKERYSLVPQSFETSLTDPEFPIHFRTEATLSNTRTGDSQ